MKDSASGILKRAGNDGHGSLEIKIVPPPAQDASEELRTNATRPSDRSRGENGLPHSPSESQLQPQPQPLPSMPVASDAAEETLRPETSCSSRDGSTDEKVTDIKIHPNTNAADPKLLD